MVLTLLSAETQLHVVEVDDERVACATLLSRVYDMVGSRTKRGKGTDRMMCLVAQAELYAELRMVRALENVLSLLV
jgi:hypothetical protein